MAKIITALEAADLIHDGMALMVGGFACCGAPHKIIDAIIKKGTKNLTLIGNDGGFCDYGVGLLIHNKQVRKIIASFVGLNPDIPEKMNAGELEVQLIPQGTLAEAIRAGGAGLGGVLTPTGIRTVAAQGKQTITVDGREYLLEKPLHADVSLIAGYKIDRAGNIWYKGTMRNFNMVMATAADLVIAEGENIVGIGEIEPENVATPGIFVDYIVEG